MALFSYCIVLIAFGLQEKKASPLPANATPSATVIPIDKPPFEATKLSFTAGWKISGERTDSKFEFLANDVLTIRFAEKPPLSRLRSQTLLLVSGAEMLGEILGVADETISFRSASLGEVKMPIGEVTAMIMEEGLVDSQINTLRTLAKGSKRQGDQIILKNRDIVAGSISTVDGASIKIKTDKGELSFARTLVAAIFFDVTLVTYQPPKELFAEIRTMDGGVCQAKSILSHRDVFKLVLVSGAEATVQVSEIVDISFQNEKVAYLSDLEPKSMLVEPFLDDARPMQKNRSVIGTRLRMAGRGYRKGLGVRSRTAIEYDAAGFKRFEAAAGLDESAGKQASAQFLVFLDDKLAYDSGEVTPVTKPKEISIDLAGAKTLKLVVDYAKRGDVDDNANWCDARLLK